MLFQYFISPGDKTFLPQQEGKTSLGTAMEDEVLQIHEAFVVYKEKTEFTNYIIFKISRTIRVGNRV